MRTEETARKLLDAPPRCKLCKGRMKEGLGGEVVWGGESGESGGAKFQPTSQALPWTEGTGINSSTV